ncbi:MAG: hypothetical protein BRD35_03945 [Bacteroidetes bacterium QH_7_62_13]|nr:MAG: hypothetical protein BRD35_03945 [Bacteroidetes bacterium QH_7_62_13]
MLDDVGLHRDTLDTFQPQPFRLRHSFILPGTERILVGSTRLDTTEYRLDPRQGRLWVRREDLLRTRDSLFATYRTFSFDFAEVYRRRRPDTTAPDTGTVDVVEEDENRQNLAFSPFEGIDIERSGSISRGFVGGTNRDVTVESGLRMQLDGEVAEDVHVQAQLTDANTPIQPGGSTQRLREFDRVYLGIEAPQGRAHLGDVDVSLGTGTFGQFDQKIQGATLKSKGLGQTLGLVDGDATVMGAVSRGRYRTQDLEPTDGVQGPYRLRGDDGEDQIIIVAGSERVFLDGERLKRGRSNDYVIDYSRGEITFTSRRLITEDRRITVEFQYSTTPFTRTIVGGEARAGAWRGADGEPRVSVGASVLRKADGQNFQSAFDLSRQDSLRLAEAGDDSAVQSGARRVEFDPEAPFVHYRREVVTTPNGARDTAFVPIQKAPAPDTPVFRVRFTRVGAGEGRYERVGRQANGRVHEYRGPGRGAYEPVQPLPAPQKQRLVDLTGSIEPVSGVEVFGEWAQSVSDENRFSSLDAADDRDQAHVAGVRLPDRELDLGELSTATLSGSVQRRARGRNFESFNQTRSVEYGRRWNLSRRGSGLPPALRGTETTDQAELAVQWKNGSAIEVGGGQLTVGSDFDAWRHQEQFSLSTGNWPEFQLRSTYVSSRNRRDDTEGTWLRQQATVRQSLLGSMFTPRLEIQRERRRQQALGTDSLTRDAFSFVEVRPGLTYESSAFEADGSVEYRTEDGAARGAFRNASQSWTIESELEYDPAPPYAASVRGAYKDRSVSDFFRVNRQRRDTESLLLNLEGRTRPLDRAVDLKLFYDAVTKRTPVLQETYIRTGSNIGQFVWRDANDDGVQQVDEFVPETTPNEGGYVQRFVPSDSLESVIDLQARTRFALRPARLWRTPDRWWKRALSAVSTRTTLEVQEKSRTSNVAEVYRLNLARFRRPDVTLDGTLRLKQEVELFRDRQLFGVEGGWRQSRTFTERAAGAERSFLNRWELQGEVRPVQAWLVRLRGRHERDRTRSEAFTDSRSFAIRTVAVRPSLSYQPVRSLTLTLSGEWAGKRDRLRDRQARILRTPFEFEWSRAGRLRLTGNVEVAQVSLSDGAVGRALFELTEGRGAGTSMLWGLQARYIISNNLRASLSYDGRAPENASVVHTARAKLSATF